MKKNMTLEKKYKLLLFFLPMLMGIILISIQVTYDLNISQRKMDQDIQAYKDQLEHRMIDEVKGALFLANYYYNSHANSQDKAVIQKSIATMIESIHSDDIGYFFAADYKGNVMFGPAQGQNMYEVEDHNGLKVVQSLIQQAKQGGGFVEYVMPPVDGYTEEARLSYVVPFEKYNWYLGFGVSLKDLEAMKTTIKKDNMANRLNIFIIMGVSILSLMFILALLNNMIYMYFKTQIYHLLHGIKNMEDLESVDDLDKLNIKEFTDIRRHLFRAIQNKRALEDNLLIADERIQTLTTALDTAQDRLSQESSAHSKALLSLEVNRQRFKAMIQAMPDAFFVVNDQGVFIDCEVNDDHWLLEGVNDFIGKRLTDIFPQNVSFLALSKIKKALATNTTQVMEYATQKDDDRYYKIHIHKFSKTEVFAIIKDVSDSKAQEFNAVYLDDHDALTQTRNRRYFEDQLHALDQPSAYPLSLVIFDINGLRLINDAFGHSVGDELVKLIARILKSHQDRAEFTARIGGDEFAMVFINTSRATIEDLIRTIETDIKTLRFYHTIVSVAIGYHSKEDGGMTMTELLNSAKDTMRLKKDVESQDMRYKTSQTILKTLNQKIPSEHLHSHRVSVISVAMAQALGLDIQFLEDIKTAGLLHDIGKISIDYDLLNKTTRLTAEEYEEIKKHPEASYKILKSLDDYAGLADCVLCHHEHFDGSGYPKGLSGNEIPLMARILCLADAFEAMTSHRPYKTKVSHLEALQELKDHAGKQFDPDLVDLFEDHVFTQIHSL